MAAAEAIHEVYVRRIKAEEVFVEKTAEDQFIFPCATGELKQLYGSSKSLRRYQQKLIADDEEFEADTVMDEEEVIAQAGELSEMEDKGDSEDFHDRDPLEKQRMKKMEKTSGH